MSLADSPSPLQAFVASRAPRAFALVEDSDDEDLQIIGWGLDDGEQAFVVGYEGDLRGTFTSAGNAHWLLSRAETSVRLVWLRPAD
ncbi:hypothetical protein BJF78_03635 [Pseudonocardia sp. CNS-139]|nr:hypothetical protein BJF78_03635 [Pseudonocardia sp. CNS-139]